MACRCAACRPKCSANRAACPPIPLTLLEQPHSAVYRLAPGDVLGVLIETILGDRTIPPPVHVAPQLAVRNQRRLPAAMGYPVPVREDRRSRCR